MAADASATQDPRARTGSGTQPRTGGAGPRRVGARAAAAAALVVTASVLLPAAGVTVWVRNEVLSTDRYVETVAPLARDPAVQAAAADRIATRIAQELDLRALTADLLDDVSARFEPLAGVIAAGAEDVIRDATVRVVESDAFAQAWVRANRFAHEQLVDVLTGREGAALTTDEGRVVLDLGPAAARVAAELEERLGITVPASVLGRLDDVEFTLFASQDLARAQRAAELLDRLAWGSVLLALALYAAAVLVAPDRRRALGWVGTGLAVASALTLVGFAFARTRYLEALPPTADRAAAEAVFDTLTRFVRDGFRALTVVGGLLVAAAWVAGPSPAAQRLRAVAGRAAVRGDGAAPAPAPGPVSRWVGAHAGGLRAAIVAVALAVVVWWEHPTGLVVVAVAAGALALAGVVGALAEAGRAAPGPAGG